jgi:chromosome segregation ATPase
LNQKVEALEGQTSQHANSITQAAAVSNGVTRDLAYQTTRIDAAVQGTNDIRHELTRIHPRIESLFNQVDGLQQRLNPLDHDPDSLASRFQASEQNLTQRIENLVAQVAELQQRLNPLDHDPLSLANRFQVLQQETTRKMGTLTTNVESLGQRLNRVDRDPNNLSNQAQALQAEIVELRQLTQSNRRRLDRLIDGSQSVICCVIL